MTYGNHLAMEYVGKEKEGKTPVTLRFFIDEATYNQMPDAKAKTPYHWSDESKDLEKIPEELRESFNAYLIAREEFTQEKRVKDSVLISTTSIPLYASKEFVKEFAWELWFGAGDAIFGPPFFRALNCGIMTGCQLARVLHALLNEQLMEDDLSSVLSKTSISSTSNMIKPVEYYKKFTQQLINEESRLAKLKNIGLNTLQVGMASSQAVPVSRGKLLFSPEGKNFKRRMRAANQDNTSLSTSNKAEENSNYTPTLFSSNSDNKTPASDNVKTDSKKLGGCNVQ